MKQHIKTLPHHPKRVIIISLIIALAVGSFGYMEINKKPETPVVIRSGDTQQNSGSSGNLTLGFLTGGRIKSVSVQAGDMVKKGAILAELDAGNTLGALAQARAAYRSAEANYQKVVNGATGPTVDVAKAAVNTAKTNLEGATREQNTLVENARRKLYSDGLIAEPDSKDQTGENPIISGNYNGTDEGDYFVSFKDLNFFSLTYNGLEKGVTEFSTLPKPLGTRGLLISFPSGKTGHTVSDSWTVHIPNKSGANYTNNVNAYELALETKAQILAAAQAALDQANANLASVATAARPEDVATAEAQVQNASGIIQIAEAAYENTIIRAPADGKVSSVAIAPGQIATPNAPAIEFISNDSLQ